MQYNKRYAEMNEKEREEWLGDFQSWMAVLSEIDTPGRTLADIFQTGLPLIRIFPYCRSFVDETLRVKDYSRRVNTLRRLSDRVIADVEKLSGCKLIYKDSSLMKRHVGRPTKAEAAARALFEKQQREKETKKPNLFNTAGDKSENLIPAPVLPPEPKGRTISEIRWLLSPQMQEEADSVYRYRAHFEEECTIAKQMAEDGRDASDIEPHTAAAARYHDRVQKIYARIDKELCVVYVRLKEDSAYIEEMSKKTKYDNKQLRTLIRPYWDKLTVEEKEAFRLKVIDMISRNDPAQAEARKIAEENKKKAYAIMKYLRRTDRGFTEQRIRNMEQKIEELAVLIGAEEAENYRPLIEKAKEYYEKNKKAGDGAADDDDSE